MSTTTRVDRNLWERREFTPAEMDHFLLLAKQTFGNARKKNVNYKNNYRKDDAQTPLATRDGYKAEKAVADSLGVPWIPVTAGRPDPGYDVRFGHRRLEVRFASYITGRPVCPVDSPIRGDWVVLVVGTKDAPHIVYIVGATTVEEFDYLARVDDLGKGPCRLIEQNELEPWKHVRECWIT